MQKVKNENEIFCHIFSISYGGKLSDNQKNSRFWFCNNFCSHFIKMFKLVLKTCHCLLQKNSWTVDNSHDVRKMKTNILHDGEFF